MNKFNYTDKNISIQTLMFEKKHWSELLIEENIITEGEKGKYTFNSKVYIYDKLQREGPSIFEKNQTLYYFEIETELEHLYRLMFHDL